MIEHVTSRSLFPISEGKMHVISGGQGFVYDMLSLAITNVNTIHPTPDIMAAIGLDMLNLCENT